MPALRLRHSLDVIPARDLPHGLAFATFTPADAPDVHALLHAGYANGFGSVAAFDDWQRDLVADAEYDPALLFLVRDDAGALVAAAHCWTSAFIKDVSVSSGWRGRGVADALLARALIAFRDRGASHVDMKVQPGNTPARIVYARVGFVEVAPAP